MPSRDTYRLDQMNAAARSMKNPELGRKTILVAGTNGKGSTCNYLTQLFLEAGLTVGTYISPHIQRRTERIRINSKEISEFELQKYEKKYAKILEPLSYFERLTLIAFLIFRDKKVDLQILEVGVGGRLDATNICDPDFSVITRIDYDHQEVLGNTLKKIAYEKAGILRRGKPVLIAKQLTAVRADLRQFAKKKKSEFIDSSKLKFSPLIEKGLKALGKERGTHQEWNARLAVSVFERAAKDWHLKLSDRNILKAVHRPPLLARLQIVRKNPLFLIDGSHNQNSIEALIQFLKAHYPKLKFEVLFGAMMDKPAAEMLRSLKRWTDKIYFPTFYPERQLKSFDLLRLRGILRAQTIKNLEEQVWTLWKGKKPILVAGSLYLAGEVLNILEKKGIHLKR
ncbi:MAG: FolC bifunctional protein [Bacteriovoracaceae bacterium]|nr:FolC bifunctional protein [Bacteriovoracaceae bacterium]